MSEACIAYCESPPEALYPIGNGQQGGLHHGQSPGHLRFPVIQVGLLGLGILLGPLVD